MDPDPKHCYKINVPEPDLPSSVMFDLPDLFSVAKL
jgi:hypothetical protein